MDLILQLRTEAASALRGRAAKFTPRVQVKAEDLVIPMLHHLEHFLCHKKDWGRPSLHASCWYFSRFHDLGCDLAFISLD